MHIFHRRLHGGCFSLLAATAFAHLWVGAVTCEVPFLLARKALHVFKGAPLLSRLAFAMTLGGLLTLTFRVPLARWIPGLARLFRNNVTFGNHVCRFHLRKTVKRVYANML
jgi:hypothetical protein